MHSEIQKILNTIEFTQAEKNEWAYKFVIESDKHIDRCRWYFDRINPSPNDKVFEIGPGCCYFLWFCREQGCSIAGTDWGIWNASSIYAKVRAAMGMNTVVEKKVEAYKPIDFLCSFDLIVCLLGTFQYQWPLGAHFYFLEDCRQHLTTHGKLILNFNDQNNLYIDRTAYEGHVSINNNTYQFSKEDLALTKMNRAKFLL